MDHYFCYPSVVKGGWEVPYEFIALEPGKSSKNRGDLPLPCLRNQRGEKTRGARL